MDRRIPSLDGARTVSITLVVVWHIFNMTPILWRFDYGNLGVRTFFVISGFLITSLLMRELQKTGTIRLRTFYARRFMRLMPAYWFYVAIVAALIPTGLVDATWHKLIPALTYTANYWQPLGALGHTWSLSAEEQFYFLWPTALLLLGLKNGRWACLALLLTAPLFRTLADAGLWPTPSKLAFECVSDALACGCALALLRESLWASPLYRRLTLSPYPWLCIVGVMLLLAVLPPYPVKDVLALPLLNISLTMLLDRYMRLPEVGFGRFLNWKPVVWIGTLSYSIYLWQQLWTDSKIPVVIAIAATILCAMASYYGIERPFLALRARLKSTQPRQNAGHVVFAEE